MDKSFESLVILATDLEEDARFSRKSFNFRPPQRGNTMNKPQFRVQGHKRSFDGNNKSQQVSYPAQPQPGGGSGICYNCGIPRL